jgi:predicted PurR-regulated permease PerM
VALFIAFVVVFIQQLHNILTPFLVAAFIAYLLDPVVDKLEERKIGRTLAVAIVFLFLSLLVTLLIVIIIPLLISQLFSFINQLPEYIAWLQKMIANHASGFMGFEFEAVDATQLKKMISQNWRQAGSLAGHFLLSLGGSTAGILAMVANLLLIPVVAFYLLRDWDRLTFSSQQFIPKAWQKKSSELFNESDEVLSAFIRGQLLVMFALGVIYSIGLSIVGLELALFLGMLAGLASVVPYMGAFVGILCASIAAYMQFHAFTPLIYVLIVFAVGQAIEGMLLTPLLVGDKIGLHPVAVIFAIMAGGQLAGFTGVLIALPVSAVLMVGLRHLSQEYKRSDFYQENADG